MKKKLNCILLIDDNPADNRYHQIIIDEMNIANCVETALNGREALNFLKRSQTPPDLIFLDINMPGMNGWEFLDEYKDLAPEEKAKIVIVILTTSANPDDITKANSFAEVNGFKTKPLTEEMLNEIIDKYFSENQD